MSEILVSICCIAYNHEKYISEALESFLKQNTNFKFEIIVHDDASTDDTPNIILEYKKKYPDIIVPIIQTENHYQKGERILPILISKARGKYIATCECDDYWDDENKLQKQVDVLEKNDTYSACVHNTTLYNLIDGTKRNLNELETESCEMDVKRILMWEEYLCFHLSSLVARKDILNELPYFFYNTKGFGDYPLALYLAACGPIYYIKENMSTYRKFTEGSWSQRCSGDISRRIIHKKSLIVMLQEFNTYSKYKYSKIIKRCIRIQRIHLMRIRKSNNEVLCLQDQICFFIDRLKNKIYRYTHK